MLHNEQGLIYLQVDDIRIDLLCEDVEQFLGEDGNTLEGTNREKVHISGDILSISSRDLELKIVVDEEKFKRDLELNLVSPKLARLKNLKILGAVRKRLGASDDDDTSFDYLIKDMSPEDLVSAWCGWYLGDERFFKRMNYLLIKLKN